MACKIKRIRRYPDGGKIQDKSKRNLRAESDSLTKKYSHLPWVKRFNEGNKLSIPDIFNPGSGKKSSHGLEYSTDDKGQAMIYPRIVQQGDSLIDLGKRAFDYAKENNTLMYADSTLADFYSKNGLIDHVKKYPEGGKVTSDEFKPITSRTAKGKLQQYNLPVDWMNLGSQAFTDSLQTKYPGQLHLPLKYDETNDQYLQNFARWDKSTPALNPQTGKANEIPEYSLGGILSSAGSGALGGAALGPWGAVAGGALGLFKGLLGHKGEKDQMGLMEQQQLDQEKLLQEQKDTAMVDYQSSNTFANRYLPTFAKGGLVPGMEPNAELEKKEVTVGPDGNIQKFDLPIHKYATADNQVALEPGTKIYSDRLKTSTGITFAEAADEIKKQINKYEKILNL